MSRGQFSTIDGGKGCVPVDALVFKTSGGRARRGPGGFDSHLLPPILFTSFLCPVIPVPVVLVNELPVYKHLHYFP